MSKALEKARQAAQAKREAGEPITIMSPIEKARANPKSLRLAINGKCFDCCGFSKPAVRDCHITSCTLHPVRPWQRQDTDDV